MLLDQFIASFDKPPRQLTLDIDPFDDPTHGQQQLTFFHGYYDQYQYLPRVITWLPQVIALFGDVPEHSKMGKVQLRVDGWNAKPETFRP